MDNYRHLQGEDYGILRKKEGKEEELFVFGYSCKIYEDCEKSLYVDQGKHLIPWLGDDSLKIDRYDCRGALNELVPYLSKSERFDRLVGLSNEEKRIESLCDQERYRALLINEDEELLHQEEELKRLQKALNDEKTYSEVAFSYDEDSKDNTETSSKDPLEEEEQPEHFIPPYQLDVPVGMKIPKSKKHHEVIEKTAFFISEQGAQMEILLKMKQADNSQFNFLSYDDELHSYYRHMMDAIKSGRYMQTQMTDEKDSDTSKSDSMSEDTYLHPSLLSSSSTVTSRPESGPKIPTISYKPSSDCTYSALVNRIKESQSANRDLGVLSSASKKSSLSSLGSTKETRSGSISSTDSNDDSRSSPALLVDGLSKSARRRRARKEKEKERNKAAVSSYKIYYTEDRPDDDEKKDAPAETDLPQDKKENASQVPTTFLKPIPAPAPVLQIPSADVQLIIDKMASYVVKNGRDFEAVVKAKGDPRFSFLNKDHIYNPFYNQKVELYLQLENAALKPPPVGKVPKIQKPEVDHSRKTNSKVVKSSRSSKPIPICFSIKKPKEEELAVKSALPCEESEGETEEQIARSHEQQTTEQNEEPNMSDIANETQTGEIVSPKIEEAEASTDKSETSDLPSPDKRSKLTLEKWAQERLVAKLVTAAKEKLAARDKDKQLQAERRRRAAEFINQLQKESSGNSTQTTQAPTVDAKNVSNGKKESSDVITILSDSSSDSDSIVSIPLNCSGEEETVRKTSENDIKNSVSLKRRLERSESRTRDKERRTSSNHRSKHQKSKRHHSHSSNRTRSRSHSHSRHSSHSKYKKHDKEKLHSKKKKHRHYENSSSHSHKESHKSKRSRYPNDGYIKTSDSESSYSSGSETRTRTRTS